VYSCSPKLHWSHRIYQSVFCTSLSSKHVRPLEALIRTTGQLGEIDSRWNPRNQTNSTNITASLSTGHATRSSKKKTRNLEKLLNEQSLQSLTNLETTLKIAHMVKHPCPFSCPCCQGIDTLVTTALRPGGIFQMHVTS
jgi:hypothetical protein